ncbi:MAG TPA: phosphatase PAP2 family protein [Anaerolineales bacterium]|nr:phosphatase PAP2 family protein [Anaerolineales bacterium]
MTISKRFPLLLLLLFVSILYFPLNQFLTNGYNLKTALDTYIPIIPVFAIPYLLFLPYWVLAFLFAAWKMNDRLFRALMIGSLGALGIATLIYFLFPTYTARPQIDVSGWSASLLNLIYSNDDVFNAFPSGHVLYTTLLALFGSTWRPNWSPLLNGSVILVVLATLLTGQHHLVDPIGGLALGWGGYRFGLWAEYGLDEMRRLLAMKTQKAVRL